MNFLIHIHGSIFPQDKFTYIELRFPHSIEEVTRETFDYLYRKNQKENSDLLTLYTIYSRRLNCMRLYQNYAKNKVFKKLESYQTEYEKRSNDKYTIISVYLLLYINKCAFNIADDSNIYKLLNFEANLQDIKHDIQFMFEKIDQKLNTLA